VTKHILIPTPFGEIALVNLAVMMTDPPKAVDRANFAGKVHIEQEDWFLEFTLLREMDTGDWRLRELTQNSRRPLPWGSDLMPWSDEHIRPIHVQPIDVEVVDRKHEPGWLKHEQIRAVAFREVATGLRVILTAPDWKAWVNAYHRLRPELDLDVDSPATFGLVSQNDSLPQQQPTGTKKPHLHTVK
jgi:hypothetical protein